MRRGVGVSYGILRDKNNNNIMTTYDRTTSIFWVLRGITKKEQRRRVVHEWESRHYNNIYIYVI